MVKFRKRVYAPGVKEDAVETVLATARTVADVATEKEIKESTLHGWVREYRLAHPEDTR